MFCLFLFRPEFNDNAVSRRDVCVGRHDIILKIIKLFLLKFPLFHIIRIFYPVKESLQLCRLPAAQLSISYLNHAATSRNLQVLMRKFSPDNPEKRMHVNIFSFHNNTFYMDTVIIMLMEYRRSYPV